MTKDFNAATVESDDSVSIHVETGNSYSSEAIISQESANHDKESFIVRRAKAMGRSPWTHLLLGFSAFTAMGVIGITAGKFSIAVDNEGWRTRGTLISERQQQIRLVLKRRNDLFDDKDGSIWDELQCNVQPSIFVKIKDQDNRRVFELNMDESGITRRLNKSESILSDQVNSYEYCDHTWYHSRDLLDWNTLNAVWKIDPDEKKPSLSALDPEVINLICLAESDSLAALKKRGLCFGCQDGECLPPHSLVRMIRSYVPNGHFMNCAELSSSYSLIKSNFTAVLVDCVDDIKMNWTYVDKYKYVTKCPSSFIPTVVEKDFGKSNSLVRYTISYFPTYHDEGSRKEMFKNVDILNRSDGHSVLAAYDTGLGFFLESYVKKTSQRDMAMAVASAFITTLAILIHTRSFWLTFIGLLQIILSFPLAYFVYYFVGGISFFPFLNFIGLFVIFALGADDIFVAVDKWKNARLIHKDFTTEEIAGKALPSAAGAMFLTTSTTAIAFFATAICPVAPILCFAVFLGLLVIFDYIMNVVLVFPALCIYDQWILRGKSNYCVHLGKKRNIDIDQEGNTNIETQDTPIHKILNLYFNWLHKLRWPLVFLIMFSIAICAVQTSKFTLPDSARVALLSPDNQFEQRFLWNEKLLSQVLSNKNGAQATIIWGIRPADTGNHNNPASGTTLELDPTFDPSTSKAQIYMLRFCDSLFSLDSVRRTSQDYECPMNSFDKWLKYQNSLFEPEQAYFDNCYNETKVPVSQSKFHKCIIAYSQSVQDSRILNEREVVKIMFFKAELRARWNSPHRFIEEEWKSVENWFDREREEAPVGINKMFIGSETFVWYDTNNSMMYTAISASIIALIGASLVVLISSRSFMMTLFGSLSIMYVLLATIACLIGMGWELGFLESICLAILIGISCDFVIHFGHAYSSLEGQQSRTERSRFALIHMGPSILAAAVTTVAAAIIMLFTEISFFQKFATVLFMTILHSSIAGFVVFLVLTDCFGPVQPTKLFDETVAKMYSFFLKKPLNSWQEFD